MILSTSQGCGEHGVGSSAGAGGAAGSEKEGQRGIPGDYSPISTRLLFAEETGESTVIFFNENRQQNSLCRVPFAIKPFSANEVIWISWGLI